MTDTNPWFPYSYPTAGYVKLFNRRTLAEELKLETVQRSNPEVVRRVVGLQLYIYDTYGLRLGWGTGWRVQPTAAPGHAAPGNSWHEGTPLASKTNAFAVDTVGCDNAGTPRHGDVWTLQETHCAGFGLVSFRYLNDRPHLQATDIPRARSFRNSLASLPVWPLPVWPLPAQYDINRINHGNPLEPTHSSLPDTSGDDDDMAKPILVRTDDGQMYATNELFSFAYPVDEETGGWLRDHRGYGSDAAHETGPYPLGDLDSRAVRAAAAHA
jgi:hypothetical protein